MIKYNAVKKQKTLSQRYKIQNVKNNRKTVNDQTQRKQALDISSSYIVQAPAGSGKTELLTQRYLKLLTLSDNPESVIAMTFTKKAVGEMTKRVVSSLKAAAKPRPLEPHKQITYDLATKVIKRSCDKNWQLLQNPKRLKISTIDSLSSLISKRYPTKSQPVPPRILAQQWEMNRFYQRAVEQTLLMIDEVEHNRVISSVLFYLDNNIDKFYRLTTSMLAKRDQWLVRLYHHDVLDSEVLDNSAVRIIHNHLRLLKKQADKHMTSQFFDLLTINTKFKHLKELPSTKSKDLGKWIDIANLLLTGKNDWRKQVTIREGFDKKFKIEKNLFVELLKSLQSADKFKQLLTQLKVLPDINLPNDEIKILKDISQVLKLCVANLNLLFADEQADDYIQVALRADNALNNNSYISDIALFLDYKIKHILIDEFQDISLSQFNLVEKLVNNWQTEDGKTIFLVGDPMQSIYRFRQAQVGVFLQVKKHGIKQIKPKYLQLTTNFRSNKSIVNANNKFFEKIFPTDENIYKGAISYSKSQSFSSLVVDNAVSFYPFFYNQQQKEAETILEIIQKSLVENPKDEIAVLVRSRSHLEYIIKILKDNNIEFESLKTAPLKNHILTRDLFSLTKALLNLGDKLAWLSVLRAPWCGLLLQDLLVFAASDKIIYQQLNDEKILKKLTKDGKKRAQHIKECLSGIINNQARFNFVELLTYAIKQLITANSLSTQEILIKRQFLQIINACEEKQSLNIQTIEDMLKNLYAPSIKAQIKLMTIHQSKGLEFDTVIFPSLGKKPRNDDPPIIHMQEFANKSLLLAPIKSADNTDNSNTYNYLKFINSEQNNFENMRLLYVAMTRAKNKLHLLGAVDKSKKANSNSLLKLLMPFYQDAFTKLDFDESSENIIKKAPNLQRFDKLTRPEINTIKADEVVKYNESLETLFKSLLGTLIHQYLEYGIFSPSVNNIKTKLIQIGMPITKIDKNAQFILKMLNNCQQDDNFAWLFKPRKSTLTEAEFTDGENIVIIDRLFIDKDILWIIDFKTANLLKNEDIDKFIIRQQNKHRKQLLFYKEVLSKIYPNKIKPMLYCPAVQRLIEI